MTATPPFFRKNFYEVIYADPPWPEHGGGKIKRGADRHYPLMSVQEIQNLGSDVRALAAPDSFLFLWVTNNYLGAGLETVGHWGYRYVTNAVWVKPSVGLGHYFRGQHELLLLGIRGQPAYSKRPANQGSQAGRKVHPSVIQAPKQAHSQKPEAAIDIIQTFSDGPYLELFARRHRMGWDCMGNEVGAML